MSTGSVQSTSVSPSSSRHSGAIRRATIANSIPVNSAARASCPAKEQASARNRIRRPRAGAGSAAIDLYQAGLIELPEIARAARGLTEQQADTSRTAGSRG